MAGATVKLDMLTPVSQRTKQTQVSSLIASGPFVYFSSPFCLLRPEKSVDIRDVFNSSEFAFTPSQDIAGNVQCFFRIKETVLSPFYLINICSFIPYQISSFLFHREPFSSTVKHSYVIGTILPLQ